MSIGAFLPPCGQAASEKTAAATMKAFWNLIVNSGLDVARCKRDCFAFAIIERPEAKNYFP